MLWSLTWFMSSRDNKTFLKRAGSKSTRSFSSLISSSVCWRNPEGPAWPVAPRSPFETRGSNEEVLDMLCMSLWSLWLGFDRLQEHLHCLPDMVSCGQGSSSCEASDFLPPQSAEYRVSAVQAAYQVPLTSIFKCQTSSEALSILSGGTRQAITS